MDGVIVILLSLILYVRYLPEKRTEDWEVTVERVEQHPRLNPELIHDEHAFMVIANELGFY